MRGVGRVLHDFTPSLIRISSFSSGSGRGRGALPPQKNVIGRANQEEEEEDDARSGVGHGALLPQSNQRQVNKPLGAQGRGQPVTGASREDNSSSSDSTPLSPFKAWQSDWQPLQPNSTSGVGRGRPISPGKPRDKEAEPSASVPEPASGVTAGKPIFLKRQGTVQQEELAKPGSVEGAAPAHPSEVPRATPRIDAPPLNIAPGYGRGKPISPPSAQYQPPEENRHARPPKRTVRRPDARQQQDKPTATATTAKLIGEEAVKQALGILAKRAEETGTAGAGGRGRGRGKGRGRGRAGVQGRGRRDRVTPKTEEEEDAEDLFLGDDADGERLVKRIGEENWNKISEAIDSVADDILPCPARSVLMDALHTNFLIEFEPEYAMESFGKNPDIDEKPPIPLRQFMEKMKPLLVAAEGIQSQEEWQELLDDAMERAPMLKAMVDYYSGPDRITARQQKEKLENIASALPSDIHPSVKSFADRALLSLQSNPGWGFDKKVGFMDKLVREVSQYYVEKRK